MNFNKAAELLLGANFVFAKTMPEHPHYYTLKKGWTDQQAFEQLVVFMRENCRIDYFKGRAYQMFLLNGYKYWTMGSPVAETTLINRAVDNDQTGDYDTIAGAYDDYFSSPEDIAEEQQLLANIGKYIQGKVLDIGCGSGMLINHLAIKPQDYIGVDPSRKMLFAFAQKHPSYQESLINCQAESLYLKPNSVNTILALFGSASYCNEARLRELIETSLCPGGYAILMMYAPGYYPVTYIKSGHAFKHNTNPTLFQGCRYGNYLLSIIQK